MNPKQKKFLLVAGIAVAVFYFAPSFINSYRRAAYVRQIEAARVAKAEAVQKSIPLPAPVTPPAAPLALARFDNLPGIWQGFGAVPDRGMCNLKLELRKNYEPGEYAGFPTLVCMPIKPPVMRPGAPNPFLAQMSPAAAALTGTAKDGAIEFHVDQIISKGSGCDLTSFRVTPFGTDQIAAQWQEGTCPGGELLLRRLGR